MLFLESNSTNKEVLPSTLSGQVETLNASTWLAELGCHLNSFDGTSMVASYENISVVGTVLSYHSTYWYEYDPGLSGDLFIGSFLAFYDQSGRQLLTSILSSSSFVIFFNIVTSGSELFVVGFSSFYLMIAKFNVAGDLIWVKNFPGLGFSDYAPGITSLAQGHCAFVCNNNYDFSIQVGNVDNDGNLIWSVNLKNNISNSEFFSSTIISSDNSGGVVVIGVFATYRNFYQNQMPFITIFSEYGEVLNSTYFFLISNNADQSWVLTAITPGYDQGYFAVGYYAVGIMVTVRLDSMGQLLSAAQLLFNGDINNIIPAAVTFTADANYAIVGWMDFNNDNSACLIGLLNQTGSPIWMTVIEYTDDFFCESITYLDGSGFVVTGNIQTQEKFDNRNREMLWVTRTITMRLDQSGFISDANMSSGFTYYNLTENFTSYSVLVESVNFIWTVENQSVNVVDITSSISITTYEELCELSQPSLFLLIMTLLVLMTMGLCRWGWQEEKRKVKAPWEGLFLGDMQEQQKVPSIDGRKSSLSGGMFGKRSSRRLTEDSGLSAKI